MVEVGVEHPGVEIGMTVLEDIARLADQFRIAVILDGVHVVGVVDIVPVDLTVSLVATPPVGHGLLVLELLLVDFGI